MEEKRYNNIDISKGIGIFLVVYGHFGGIPNLNPSYFSVLYQFVYTFHMPLFMALSGFLFGKLFSEDFSYKSFIIKKAKRLIIPYITYSLLLFIIKYAAGFFVTLKYPLLLNDAIYFILVQPNIGFASFLWFIYTLFLIFCIVPFFKKINHLFIISLILYFIPFPPYFCIGLVAKYLIYFTIGIYMYRYILSDKKTKRPFAVFVFTSLLMLLLFFAGKQYHYLSNNFISLIIASAGILSVFAFSEIVENITLFNKPLLYLGRHSSEIYLLHTICMGVVGVLLANIPLEGAYKFYVTIISVVACGLFIPIFIKGIIVRYNIPIRLLLFGEEKTNKQ